MLQWSRLDLQPSWGARRIVRAGWQRDGNQPHHPIGGVYLRLPTRIYFLSAPSRFRVIDYP